LELKGREEKRRATATSGKLCEGTFRVEEHHDDTPFLRHLGWLLRVRERRGVFNGFEQSPMRGWLSKKGGKNLVAFVNGVNNGTVKTKTDERKGPSMLELVCLWLLPTVSILVFDTYDCVCS
jgi:hypothetical protein